MTRQRRCRGRKECVKDLETDLVGRLTHCGAPWRARLSQRGFDMSVVVFTVLTVAIFALLGLIQRGVERL
jgi:hypothetical protein